MYAPWQAFSLGGRRLGSEFWLPSVTTTSVRDWTLVLGYPAQGRRTHAESHSVGVAGLDRGGGRSHRDGAERGEAGLLPAGRDGDQEGLDGGAAGRHPARGGAPLRFPRDVPARVGPDLGHRVAG